MALRLYFDEDAMNSAVLAELVRRGFDATSASAEGRRGMSDTEQLEFATAQGRVVYTCNAGDFARLHRAILAAGRHHAGIIVVYPQNLPIGAQIRSLVALSEDVADGSMIDRLEYLAAWQKALPQE